MVRHEILGGLVQVYKRGGKFWHCSASVDGRQHRTSTKEEELPQAKQFAEDWYLTLRGKARAGLLKNEKTFGEAADQFEKEYEVITEGQRSPRWTEGHKARIRVHLRPFFGKLGLSDVTPGKVQEYTKSAAPRFQWNAEQVHDYVLFMANTGLRPDEAKNLQHRDVSAVQDRDTGERILEIEVRGKRGVGFCKSMPGAVLPYQRLLKRAAPGENENGAPRLPQPGDPVFPGNHIKLFNGVLRRANLKLDRDANKRTAYSLRHTYICTLQNMRVTGRLRVSALSAEGMRR